MLSFQRKGANFASDPMNTEYQFAGVRTARNFTSSSFTPDPLNIVEDPGIARITFMFDQEVEFSFLMHGNYKYALKNEANITGYQLKLNCLRQANANRAWDILFSKAVIFAEQGSSGCRYLTLPSSRKNC